jgi:hypothetical protein
MWHKTFADRLSAWSALRTEIQTQPLPVALKSVSDWWHQAPWSSYYLHWDDRESWPDPWQLLSDNIYCDLAKGLGILYTLTLTERKDLISVELILTEDNRNLVLVNKGKYILNWDEEVQVNTPTLIKAVHSFIKSDL